MARKRENEYRDPATGQYSYFGDFDRLCVCGHSLGAHIAGGFECGTNPADYPETKGCQCQKFKPTRNPLTEAQGKDLGK